MERVVRALVRADSIEAVFAAIRVASASRGAIGQSYHFTPRFESQVSSEVIVEETGFPERWVSLYNSEQFRACDPIPDAVMAEGRPIIWSDALAAEKLTAERRNFHSAWVEHGLRFGIGIPLFGPRNQNAYSSFAFADAAPLGDPQRLTYLQLIMQAAHLRICDLIEEDDTVCLSARETEVMSLVGQGRSAKEIARALAISPETVSTYLARAYEKLHAGDRVSAVVKALKLGLIRI